MLITTIILLFTSIAIVSTRNMYQITTSYKYIQSEPYSVEHKRLSDPNEVPKTVTNYDCQTEVSHEKNTQRQEYIKAKQDTNQSHKKDYPNGHVFTNVNRHQYNINVKYIKRLDEGIDPDVIVFNDNIEDDRKPPFTNKRPENNTKYEISINTDVSRKGPAKLPDVHGSTKHQETTESYSDRLKPSPKINVNDVNRYNNTSGDRTQNTTQLGFELDDRVAFEGDKCATGLAKVAGKCVPKQD